MQGLETVLGKMCEDMGVWSAAIMVPDTEQNVLVCKAGHNLPEDWAALTNPFDDTTFNGRSYTKDETVIENGINITTVRGAPTVHLIAGILVVPVKKEDNVIGTLEVINDDPQLSFNEKEVKIAQETARQISELL